MTAPLNGTQQSAKAIISQQLADWGLSTLNGTLDTLIKDGLSSDAITLALQDTPQYKTRFSANEARLKKGLPVLTPAQYISAENSYRQVMQSYGLPKNFYDSHDDFNNFLANDVSPDEVKQRAQDAQQVWLTTDQATRDEWRHYYGLSDGAAIASILDPQKALPVVNRMATAAQIGAAAQRNGLSTDRGLAESFADAGVTADQAQKAFGQIGATWQQQDAMAQRYGMNFTQTDAQKAALTGDAAALRKQQELFSAEKGMFSDTAAASETSQTTRQTGAY